jgi:hypothetical protein
MIHFLVAFGLLLHVTLWGAGLALLAMPRPWRRFWPVLVLPAGFLLQSVVVWLGAYANLPGTQSYAVWTEPLPLILLALGFRRRGWIGFKADVSRFGVVAGVVAGCLLLLVLPLAFASRGLTTTSLGSNDAADYAAGARVLLQFAHSDRAGFLGLTEVVQLHSVDNFFDHWLRLNHFTPSALIAFNGAILGCAPHEIVGLMTMVTLVGAVPLVFWVARAVIGYSGGASLVMAALYGLSPVNWYAVAHVSPGQMLAAQSVALITWAGIALWRGRLTWSRAGQFAAVLAIGYGILLGAYNFMLLVCLVPAVAYSGSLVLGSGEWRRFGRWLVAMLAPLGLASLLFAERVAGLAERFLLLRAYDFGWRIPMLGPEGWLGMVQGPGLDPWSWAGVRWLLAFVVLAMLGWALWRGWRQRRRAVWVAICLTVPVLVGYAYLEARGAQLGTNASYDAYKLFASFFTLLLPAFCWWVTLRRSRRLFEWMGVVTIAAGVIALNFVACVMFIVPLARPPLQVDGELRQLRRIEAMADVASVNLMIPDMWSRLWANAFLLRKAQYFPTHTYEGRLNTPLRGDWDLEGGRIALLLPGDDRRSISERFALVNARSPNFVRVTPGAGWHAEEVLPGTTVRWQWTDTEARLEVENPHDTPRRLTARIDGLGFGSRRVTLARSDEPAARAVELGSVRTRTTLPPVVVPPGRSTLMLRSSPPASAPPGEIRRLAVCVFRIELTVAE